MEKFVDVDVSRTNNYSNPGKKGTYTRNGRLYYLKIKKRANRNTVKDNLFRLNPIYTSDTFRTAPDGVYTWLESERGFFAIKTKNKMEIATLHMDLAIRTESTKIFVAGECLKVGNSINFNTSSGTYSLEIIHKYGGDTSKELRERAVNLFLRMGFDIHDTQNNIKTYITNNYTPTQLSNLRNLQRIGYNVRMFNNPTNASNIHLASLKSQKNTAKRVRNTRLRLGVSNTSKINSEIEELERQIALHGTNPINFSSWE